MRKNNTQQKQQPANEQNNKKNVKIYTDIRRTYPYIYKHII